MKPLWLLGADIAHSLSPMMHNAALAALGEPARYALRPCSAAELGAALDAAELTCRGVNLTAPHKVATAQRYAAVLDRAAAAAGAVNTVVFDDGCAVRALNTDVPGLLSAWRRSNVVVRDQVVAVVGAGGAARAVVVAAREAGARRLLVHCRRPEAAAQLLGVASACGLEGAATEHPQGASLVVLAASTLDHPGAWIARALDRIGTVHDLRYGPSARSARNAALEAGHLFLDGSVMLLVQAQLAMAAFLGCSLPDDAAAAMRHTLARVVSSPGEHDNPG